MPIPRNPARLTALALAAGLAACSPPRENPDTVVIWHQKTGAERVFFEEVVRDFNAAHAPDRIEAVYREGEELRNSFIIAAVAGQGPDLVFGPADNVTLFAGSKVIRPWDEAVDAGFFERFTADGVVRWQGEPWLVADQIGNQLMLVCDRQMVEKPPATLDDLIEIGRRLRGAAAPGERPERFALTWNYTEPYFFIPFLTGFGGWIMDKDDNPTLDTPATRAALQFILDLRDVHGVIPHYEDYDTANLMFLRRRAAMIINGPWSWADYGVPERSMLALLPVNSATGLRCRPIVSAKGYSLNVNTPAEKFPLVARVLDHLTGGEVQMKMALRLFTTPTLKEALASPAFATNPELQLARRQAEYAVPMPLTPRLRYIWDAIRGPYRKVFSGELTPDEAARAMQADAERRLREARM